MSQIDPGQEQLRLKSLYAQKNDEELLILWSEFEGLTQAAQSALRDEMYQRKLKPDESGLQREYSAEPAVSESFILNSIRAFGIGLSNLIVAVFGTAIIEGPIGLVYHPRTINAVLFKGDLLSALCGFALGLFISRRWNPRAARWVGAFGILWFALGASIDISHGMVWSRMSGVACSEGLHAAHCMKWFVFTLPAVRTIFYSAGAWLSWSLTAKATSSVEDAVTGSSKVSLHVKQS